MLRILTKKSKMMFGKYSDLKVSDLLVAQFKGREYLRWVYYNMSNISFIGEVLLEIGIIDEIEKPGKQPDLFTPDEYERRVLTVEEASKLKHKKLKRQKATFRAESMKTHNSKSRFAKYNGRKY